MNFRNLSIILAGTLLFGEGASAAPTLLGDTISFLRAYPSTSTPYGPLIPDTTVAAGISDQVTWSSTSPATFDPEANSITLSFGSITSYIGAGATFDGFVISGLDNDIASVSLGGNSSGLTVDLTHNLRSIFVDLNGSTISGGSFTFAVNLADTVSNVPEPSTLALLASTLIGFTGAARRRRSR